MGFLKDFFSTQSEPYDRQQEQKQEPSDVEPVSSSQLSKNTGFQYSIPETSGLKDTTQQQEKIKRIETEALENGWTKDQLWKLSKRWNENGLLFFLKPEHTIEKVTPQYIELSWQTPHGKKQISRFYNMRVDQPWLKHLNTHL